MKESFYEFEPCQLDRRLRDKLIRRKSSKRYVQLLQELLQYSGVDSVDVWKDLRTELISCQASHDGKAVLTGWNGQLFFL